MEKAVELVHRLRMQMDEVIDVVVEQAKQDELMARIRLMLDPTMTGRDLDFMVAEIITESIKKSTAPPRPVDLERIRGLAAAAIPGWRAHDKERAQNETSILAGEDEDFRGLDRHVGLFLLACGPDVVLSLIDRLVASQSVVARLRERVVHAGTQAHDEGCSIFLDASDSCDCGATALLAETEVPRV